MNMPLMQQQTNRRESNLRGADGSIYYIDRSFLIFRDSKMNAVYSARRVKKIVREKKDADRRQNLIEEQIQEKSVYLKQYSEFYSQEQIQQEWKYIQLIKGQKFESSLMNLFIDLAKESSVKKYYLVFTPFKGTLSNHFKRKSLQITALNERQDKLNNFCLQFAAFLYHIHFQLLNNNKSKTALILTSLEPANLATECYQNSKGPFLLSCSNSIICSSEKQVQFTPRGQTLAYFAPEMRSNRISTKSNVWSFGCILYELLGGQRLIESQSHYLQVSYEYLTRYLAKRISWLSFKLSKTQRPWIFWRGYWMKIVKGCLQVQASKRWSAQQLHNNLATLSKQKDGPGLDPLEQKQCQSQMCYYLSFQNTRINMIQYKLMNLFELLDSSRSVSKYLIYIVIKFAACFVSGLYHKSKEMVQQFAKVFKTEKYVHIMIAEEDNKFRYVRENINDNIAKLMQQELDYPPLSPKKSHKQPFQLQLDIKRYFPEYAESNLHQPQKLLQYFCYKYSGQICKDAQIGQQIAGILLYSRDLVDVRELSYHESELTSNIEVFVFKKINAYITNCQRIGQNELEQIYLRLFTKQIGSNAAASVRMTGIDEYQLKKQKR